MPHKELQSILANAASGMERQCCLWRRLVAFITVLSVAVAHAAVRLCGLPRLAVTATAASAVTSELLLASVATEQASPESSTSGFKVLFVYGTLKKDFHWHAKFLGEHAKFLGRAITLEPIPLVIGACGVPYLLLDQCGCMGDCGETHVHGELWQVSADYLRGMDDYEGLGKGYYRRTEIACLLDHSTHVDVPGPMCSSMPQSLPVRHPPVLAQAYGVADSRRLWDAETLKSMACIAEYTLDMQDRMYRPIAHISLKQQLYLEGTRRYNSAIGTHVCLTKAS